MNNLPNRARIAVRVLLGSGVVACALMLASTRAQACPSTDATSARTADRGKDQSHRGNGNDGRDRDADRHPNGQPPAHTSSPKRHERQEPATKNAASPPVTRHATQTAVVDTHGTAVSDTGGNTTRLTRWSAPPSNAASSARPGAARATAGTAANNITQWATAHVSDQASVDIVQIAAVVNIGLAQAGNNGNAGMTVASAHAAPQIQTGNATALGNAGHTTVTQAVVVGRGNAASQATLILNVGTAVANTGLNRAVGGTSTHGTAPAVVPGAAFAIGNVSSSTIEQSARGVATGTAVLRIEQRAIVVNFGVAIANSGGNMTITTFDPAQFTAQQATIARAILGLVAPLFPPGGAPARAPNARGSGGATIATGAAIATGNMSATRISQTASGTVSQDGIADAEQLAAVGNTGLAIANTGLNAATPTTGSPSPAGTPPLDTNAAAAAVARLLRPLQTLDWLHGPNPFTTLSERLHLGSVTLDLISRFTATDYGAPKAVPGTVRVRQISAVIDIGIGNAQGDRGASAGVPATSASAPGALVTGDARALGNQALVSVCQTLNNDAGCTALQVHHVAAAGANDPAATRSAHARLRVALQTRIHITAQQHDVLPATGVDSSLLATLGGLFLLLGTASLAATRRTRLVGSRE